ncbi:MAG: flagellar hook protein FlgE [Deltaproteobacteria bacterium]|nr:flagellar hook protein FlgE [Deltaproteobacteria bacterium]
MALSSSLFSGISGLSSLGNAMQIIGDNIANVNTVGFKGSSFTFQDLLSQSISTQSGTAQVGRGTAIGDVAASFEQGAFESTGSTTDLAIGGDGFFTLREAGSDSLYYSRAGKFRFDNDGYLTNPEGYVVQGWRLDDQGENIGSMTDVLLDSFTSNPDPTDNVTIITNLDSDAVGHHTAATLLADDWDATSGGMPSDKYEYQSTVKVFDSLGSTHDITIYFDKEQGASTWQYAIACNPNEDGRAGAGGATQGLLARGKINFSESAGTILPNATDFTMDTYDPSAGSWTPVTPNTAGYLEFLPDFLGGAGGSTVMNIALDLGSHFEGAAWTNAALTTTQYARSSSTIFQSADGYGAGDLKGVDVDVDGTMTGLYSNGQLIPLYRVALSKFQNVQGLHKEGSSLYRQTRESGDAITGDPGTNGLGSISPNSLEQSNVDIANEFVKMITTQRGFQANSKIITVTDQMLAELINLKR